VSAPFVVHHQYGTRCSTVVLVSHDGRTVVQERRFDPRGVQSGVSRFEFTIGDAPSGRRAVAAAASRPATCDASPE
jgi:hypothetical protein